jgi:hypothetical protein
MLTSTSFFQKFEYFQLLTSIFNPQNFYMRNFWNTFEFVLNIIFWWFFSQLHFLGVLHAHQFLCNGTCLLLPCSEESTDALTTLCHDAHQLSQV